HRGLAPTGDQVVFSRKASASAPGAIWIIHADGTGMHQLKVKGLACGTSVGCHEPRWSPDGEKIIFAANHSSSSPEIDVINADGTVLKRVTFGYDPRWGTHPPAHYG